MIGHADCLQVSWLERQEPFFECDSCGREKSGEPATRKGGTYCQACFFCPNCKFELDQVGDSLCSDCLLIQEIP